MIILGLFLFAVVVVGVFVFVVAPRRIVESMGEPTQNGKIELREAKAQAKETSNASDDDISRRIDELRERGRSGK